MKKQNNSSIEWAMQNKSFPLALALLMVSIGLFGLFNMPRNEFPDFTIRQGLIIGYYPGANSKEVEQEFTSKVEEYLFGFNEVDKTKTYSYSQDGKMYIYVEVANRVDADATQQFWNKLKNGLLVFQQQKLPAGVRGIIVNSEFGSTAAMILAVQSSSRPYKDLQNHVEDIEDNLRQLRQKDGLAHHDGITSSEQLLNPPPLLEVGRTTCQVYYHHLTLLSFIQSLKELGSFGYAFCFFLFFISKVDITFAF